MTSTTFYKKFETLFEEILNKSVGIDALGSWSGAISNKGDEGDLAMSASQTELLLKIKSRESFFVKKVYKAIEKIKNGSFGECEDCGDTIKLSRLQARPMAELCICCKEESERDEGQLLYAKKSHTQGKQILNGDLGSVALAGDSVLKQVLAHKSYKVVESLLPH